MCILLLNLAVPLARADTLFGVDSLSNCQAVSALKLLPWTLDFATNSPLRSTLNTNVITGLGMRQVCTEAVHCVAL